MRVCLVWWGQGAGTTCGEGTGGLCQWCAQAGRASESLQHECVLKQFIYFWNTLAGGPRCRRATPPTWMGCRGRRHINLSDGTKHPRMRAVPMALHRLNRHQIPSSAVPYRLYRIQFM